MKEQLVGEKLVLIYFWFVSCQMCKEVMLKVNEFCDKYKDYLNVVVVYIFCFEDDFDFKKIKKIVVEYGIFQLIYIDSNYLLIEVFENEYVLVYYVFDKIGQFCYF